MDNKINEKEVDYKIFRDYAWSYFQVHADQRMKIFQFYVAFSTAVIGGGLILYRFTGVDELIFCLGGALVCVSFVFWKLDVRSRNLVKNAESALKWLDKNCLGDHGKPEPHPLSLFERDDYLVKSGAYGSWMFGFFSYSKSLSCLYLIVSLLGVVMIYLNRGEVFSRAKLYLDSFIIG